MRGGLLAPLIKLVAFLVVTSFATYVLAATIANTSFGATRTYHAYFTDASGLQVGDDVRVAGVRVGTVSSISVVRENIDHSKFVAKVGFSVAKSRPLPTGVQINLRYRNLVGQRYLDVEQGAGNSTTLLSTKTIIPVSQTAPAVDLTQLFAGFQPLFEGLDAGQINDLSTEIIQTLQGEGGSIETLLSTLADLTNAVADKDHVIGEVIDNLTSVLTTIGNRDSELDSLIVQLQGFVSGLADDRTTIGNAISGINTLANSTAGLLTDIRGPLAKDVTDVTGLVGVLNKNQSSVKFFLDNLAPTVGALIRTASYGSWFNFYLCGLSGSLTLPGGKVVDLNAVASSKARCQ
ncbi:MAG: Phospholipid/cholesterol/gamma-HCH transport system substrate-binding protein [Marmoricola sp.]|nr:Phospholipid/cholesterol/gamma-HCH transport system substrate-binding protein [Marmoricola sp.]